MIRVLIAEDSVTVRELLRELLSASADMTVVGEAGNGLEAIELTRLLRPDVVVMDIRMPRLDGFDATRQIMIEAPTPIVIVSSSVDVRSVEISMHALRAGALAAIPKPEGPRSPAFEQEASLFVGTVRSMSQVKVVRRWPEKPPRQLPPAIVRGGARPEIIAIAASTGGPAAVQKIISELPAGFPAPLLLVQHIARGFAGGFATWLNTAGSLRVELAEDGKPLRPGTVYVAPDERHLGLSSRTQIALADAPPINGFRPSANHLFASVAKQFGPAVVAVMLTGMGDDGCEGLREVRREGGRVVVQDESTSVVFGMPGAAIAAGLADWTLPVGRIAHTLRTLTMDEEEPR